MRAKAAIVLAILIPASAYCFIDLVDIGLFNAFKVPVESIVEYSSGRKFAWHLESKKSIIMKRGFGEHVVSVTVSVPGRAARRYILQDLRRRDRARKGDEWLYIGGDKTRLISADELHALEKSPKT